MNGGSEITELQIVRSQPWKRLMAIVRGAWKDEPNALLKLESALGALENEGKL